MVRLALTLLALILLGACSRRTPSRAEPVAATVEASRAALPEPAAPAEQRPIAVVELFTSEGCSSCPPADENLMAIADRARSEDRAVYALSFHVDYWNDLGWSDPFSDPAHSRRQRSYARRLGGGRIYTPQLVVNGREELLGSDRSSAGIAIERALARPAELSIHATLSKLTVRWHLSALPERALLNFAVVQGARNVAVTRGENRGRTLSHANVVRAFSTASIVALDGTRELVLPRDVKSDAGSLVLYAQDEATLAVLGATALPLD